MTWFKVDDTLATHPKARRAGLQAIGLWSVAGAYAAQHLTEGFVPEWFVASWPSGRKLAGRLVAAKLWVPAEQDGEPGWSFHQWDERQPSKEQVETEREANRERQRRWRASRRDRHVRNAVTNEAPSRPVLSHGSVVGRPQTEPRGDDDDEDTQLAKIAAATGGDREHAARVRADVLSRANGHVNDPLAYVLRAIGDDPARYRATYRPPRRDQECELHPGEFAGRCRGCAADAKAVS